MLHNNFILFLLQGLMDKLKEKGIQTLWLEVRESNPARFLYEKLGFSQVGRRRNFYENPREDAFIMTKFFRKGAAEQDAE